MYPPNMKSTRLVFALIAVIALAVSGCQRSGTPDTRTLTLAINSGVEGDALKQAAKDYEQQTGIHIKIAEFPYANLFEKELIDLRAHGRLRFDHARRSVVSEVCFAKCAD